MSDGLWFPLLLREMGFEVVVVVVCWTGMGTDPGVVVEACVVPAVEGRGSRACFLGAMLRIGCGIGWLERDWSLVCSWSR